MKKNDIKAKIDSKKLTLSIIEESMKDTLITIIGKFTIHISIKNIYKINMKYNF